MKKTSYHSNGLEHIRTWCAVAGLIVGVSSLVVAVTILNVVLLR